MFTQALKNFTSAISNNGRPKGTSHYPCKHSSAVKMKTAMSPTEWLRLVQERNTTNYPLAIEQTIALTADLHWTDNKLTQINMQALWCEGGIEAILDGETKALANQEHQYLRLDYHTDALGAILKEPAPHVHARGKAGARFPVPADELENPISWFLDFIYRTYAHDAWALWAKDTWTNYCLERSKPNTWNTLEQAFKQSKSDVLSNNDSIKSDLIALKKALRTERLDQLFTLPLEGRLSHLA